MIDMKRVTLDELEKTEKINSYNELYTFVIDLLQKGELKPIKAAGLNGKKPALYKEYKRIENSKDFSVYENELLYEFAPCISTDYYLHHLKQYEEDREWVLLLNHYLKTSRNLLQIPKSVNERSFEIWHREKFLKEECGKKILKRCGMNMEQLYVYDTTEPLAYYVHTRDVPQNMLIVENKDTFYSLRKHLLSGKYDILENEFGTLIYGAGKGIYRSFQDFSLCAEPYMRHTDNALYYWGDLDYEGILIFETLSEKYANGAVLKPFVKGYMAMLKKAEKIGFAMLPNMKEAQNQNIGTVFYSYFETEYKEKIQMILDLGKYIPQEILSLEDF